MKKNENKSFENLYIIYKDFLKIMEFLSNNMKSVVSYYYNRFHYF